MASLEMAPNDFFDDHSRIERDNREEEPREGMQPIPDSNNYFM